MSTICCVVGGMTIPNASMDAPPVWPPWAKNVIKKASGGVCAGNINAAGALLSIHEPTLPITPCPQGSPMGQPGKAFKALGAPKVTGAADRSAET